MTSLKTLSYLRFLAFADSHTVALENLPSKVVKHCLAKNSLSSFSTFSDDTQHNFLVFKALLAQPCDPFKALGVFSQEYKAWMKSMPPHSGKASLKSGLRLIRGVSPFKSGTFSAGNAACMRAPAIGYFFNDVEESATDFANLVKTSQLFTQISHTDPKALISTLIVALAVNQIKAGRFENWDEFTENVRALVTSGLVHLGHPPELGPFKHLFDVSEAELAGLNALADLSPFLTAKKLIKSSNCVTGYCVETVSLAYLAFGYFAVRGKLNPTIHDVKNHLTQLAYFGGDVDTYCVVFAGLLAANGNNVLLFQDNSAGVPDDWEMLTQEALVSPNVFFGFKHAPRNMCYLGQMIGLRIWQWARFSFKI